MYDIRKNIINSLAVLGLNRSQFCKRYGFELPNFSRFLNGEPTLGVDKVQSIMQILTEEISKLKRFKIKILLNNGNEAEVRVSAADEQTALDRIKTHPIFIDFVGDSSVLSVEAKEDVDEKMNPKNYLLQPSKTDKGWWVVTDVKRNIVTKFKQGKFNETQHNTVLFDEINIDPLELATAMRGISEFLHVNHKDLL